MVVQQARQMSNSAPAVPWALTLKPAMEKSNEKGQAEGKHRDLEDELSSSIVESKQSNHSKKTLRIRVIMIVMVIVRIRGRRIAYKALPLASFAASV